MKLHPVTQLVLVAVALRLAAGMIAVAYAVRSFADPGYDPVPLSAQLRFLGGDFQELAQTMVYVAMAAWIEMLSRWAGHLKSDRQLRHARQSGAMS